MMRSIFVAASAAFLLLSPQILPAQGTKLWLQSQYDEFEKGQPQSVAILSNGYLESGPELRSVLLTPSTYLWAAASDRQGNVYLATGSPATVLKVSPDGKSTKLFSTRDLSVQAVAVAPDGSVYAATLPSGKVYRIGANQANLNEATATVVFDPATAPEAAAASGAASASPQKKPGDSQGAASPSAPPQAERHRAQVKYIWDLAFDKQGALYIATGGPAAIFRIGVGTPNAKPELFFSSDEQHIRCLLFEPDGNLLAGSDGTGLVYRIGKNGQGMVIYDAPKREVTSLAEAPDGRIYVASVGEKGKSSLPPLPVQGNVSVTATITIIAPGSVQASRNNGVIPEGSEVDELNRQGAPRKLWASSQDVVYALEETPRGLLAATGNRGRIYRIDEDGSYADLARATSGQAMAFAKAPGGTWVATSNTGRVYMLGDRPAEGNYQSDVFDAGAFSTWGRAEVNANDNGETGPYQLFVRSGNVENPERNWSPWQRVAAGSARVPAPAARFVQWKAVLQPGARLSSVGINFLPVNIAPVVDAVAVAPGVRTNRTAAEQQQPQPVTINLTSGQPTITSAESDAAGPLAGFKDRTAVTIRWAAHDSNGDQLVYDVYIRGDGEKDWRLLKAELKQTFYTFDSNRLPDGGYRAKIVASDAPSHPPGEALTGEQLSDHFVIDTTPPVLSALTAKVENGKVHIAFQAADAISPIAHAEYSLDAGPWQYIDPAGKLSDSLTEQYQISVPLPPPVRATAAAPQPTVENSEHLVTVRAYDRYGNVSAAKTVVH